MTRSRLLVAPVVLLLAALLTVPLRDSADSVLAVFLVNLVVAAAVVIYLLTVKMEALFLFSAVLLGLLSALAIAVVVSDDPIGAIDALLTGPLSRTNRWGTWIEDTITLCFLGLSYAIVFRANQISLGADGQLHIGALFAAAAGLYLSLPGPLHIAAVIVAAMIGGFVWGLVPGLLKSRYRANEIVSTLMLNAIAIRLYIALINGPMKDPTAGFTQTTLLEPSALLPTLVADTRITIALVLAIVTVVVVALFINRSTTGYRLRMVGANSVFARFGGINERRMIWLSMAISGVLAGLAGLHLTAGIHDRLILNISLGLGFEGIVVALLARNRPLAVPFAALLYAYIRTGAQIMERESDVSFELVRVVQAVIILVVTVDRVRDAFEHRRQRREKRRAETVGTPAEEAIAGA